jgi:hypothetical protein
LSAHGVHYLLAKHVAAATTACPSLKHKRVSPHVLRHTTAMDLLQHGVEQSVIALWLGHESIETTQIYFDADLELEQRVLDMVTPLNGKPGARHTGRGEAFRAHVVSYADDFVILSRGRAAEALTWTDVDEGGDDAARAPTAHRSTKGQRH